MMAESRVAGWLAVFCFPLLSCQQDIGDDPGNGEQSVQVVYGTQEVTVDLEEADTVSFDGDSFVPLDRVLELAELGTPLSELELDFVASDGFRPTNSPNCTEDQIPAPGEQLELGYIHPQTRDLVWDESLGLPGCMHVHDTAEIHANDR